MNQAVNRNNERFPENFCFQLTDAEWHSLRSQFVILESGKGKHEKFASNLFEQARNNGNGPLFCGSRIIETYIHNWSKKVTKFTAGTPVLLFLGEVFYSILKSRTPVHLVNENADWI